MLSVPRICITKLLPAKKGPSAYFAMAEFVCKKSLASLSMKLYFSMPSTSLHLPIPKQSISHPTRTSKNILASKPRTSTRSLLTCRGLKVKISTWKPLSSLLPVHPQYLSGPENTGPASGVVQRDGDCWPHSLSNPSSFSHVRSFLVPPTY